MVILNFNYFYADLVIIFSWLRTTTTSIRLFFFFLTRGRTCKGLVRALMRHLVEELCTRSCNFLFVVCSVPSWFLIVKRHGTYCQIKNQQNLWSREDQVGVETLNSAFPDRSCKWSLWKSNQLFSYDSVVDYVVESGTMP